LVFDFGVKNTVNFVVSRTNFVDKKNLSKDLNSKIQVNFFGLKTDLGEEKG